MIKTKVEIMLFFLRNNYYKEFGVNTLVDYTNLIYENFKRFGIHPPTGHYSMAGSKNEIQHKLYPFKKTGPKLPRHISIQDNASNKTG